MFVISDTGSTQNYIIAQTPCNNKVKTTITSPLLIPDIIIMQATHWSKLNLSPVQTTIIKVPHIFHHLQSGGLICIGKLCVDVCTATFIANHMNAVKPGQLVLDFTRKGATVMRHVDLTSKSHTNLPPTKQSVNNLMVRRN